jgi:hypothetical protein
MIIDPGTGLSVLGTSILSKELVTRMLGPTADYLGTGMKNWTEQGGPRMSKESSKRHSDFWAIKLTIREGYRPKC